jgi:dTDP-glucose 4,6-dehydratase
VKILVAGGAGFIGSHFVRHMLAQHPAYRITVVDKLTYAGSLANLKDAQSNPRFDFRQLDICDPEINDAVRGADVVLNLAAESHVDRSIEDASVFVRSNVEGTFRLLEACRRQRIGRFIQVSTDEVYGSLGPQGKFDEASPLSPNSPYAATKASADLLVLAAMRTHSVPAIITRSSNNYGPYQHPEKFIPLMIAQAMAGEPLPLYGDGRNVRDWLHVEDHCRALDAVVHRGAEGEVYNVGGEYEIENLEVARRVLDLVGKPRTLIQFVSDRPGHDRRYAMKCERIKSKLGWRQEHDFETGLPETIRWYRENREWLDEMRNPAYREYFARQYQERDRTLARKHSAR